MKSFLPLIGLLATLAMPPSLTHAGPHHKDNRIDSVRAMKGPDGQPVISINRRDSVRERKDRKHRDWQPRQRLIAPPVVRSDSHWRQNRQYRDERRHDERHYEGRRHDSRHAPVSYDRRGKHYAGGYSKRFNKPANRRHAERSHLRLHQLSHRREHRAERFWRQLLSDALRERY